MYVRTLEGVCVACFSFTVCVCVCMCMCESVCVPNIVLHRSCPRMDQVCRGGSMGCLTVFTCVYRCASVSGLRGRGCMYVCRRVSVHVHVCEHQCV